MSKYREYFREMLSENEFIFANFKKIHDLYTLNPHNWEDEFNAQGTKVVGIIRAWERKLCSHSEKGQYGKYSATLADKFWNEVRAFFPKIDFVGAKIS